MADTARISPTAHYTGFVWYRNRLSHPAFRTRTGWLLFQLLRPANALYHRRGGPTLEHMLLARHRIIDHLLGAAIRAGEVHQVIEIAAGLSPRGQRIRAAHPHVTYVEGDLPGMAARKRHVLDRLGHDAAHHVVELDALTDDGPRSLAAVAERLLDPSRGTAIITEGLLSYFDRATAEGIFGRISGVLRRFPRGLFLSDMHLGGEVAGLRGARAFQLALSVFARGGVHLHYKDADACAAALRRAGFDRAAVHAATEFVDPLGLDNRRAAGLVRVVEARTGRFQTL